jgi:adenylate cyclase
MSSRWSRALAAIVVFAAVAAAAGVYFHRPPAPLGNMLWRLELGVYDSRLSSRPSQFTDRVVIVAIDNESLTQEADGLDQWPWRRSVHARLVDKLTRDGALVIGMDILFDSPSSVDSKDDEDLAAALARSGRVILAGQLNEDTSVRGEEMATGVAGVSFPYDPFAATMLDVGLTNIPRDPDATVRRAWVVRQHQDEPYYTLPLMLAAKTLKRDPAQLAAEALAGADSAHPYLGGGTVLINYSGPAGTIKYVPYYQVLEGITPPGTFRDKIVLVGGTAEILQDIYPTPMARMDPGRREARLVQMPGVEVQANALLTLLRQSYIRPAPVRLMWAATVVLALLIAAVTVLWRPLRAGLLTGVLLVVAVLTAYLLMYQLRLWLPVVPLLLAGALAYVEGTVYLYFTEERARLRLRRAWQQRVSAEVLQVILDNPVPKVQGRKLDATVMFSDLRGFTTMCSTSAPEYVIERLNDYLTGMTEVIREFGGTIHKFIGDGIMAVFGDPVAHPDHAARAVRAAVAMQRNMAERNVVSAAAGQPPLHMGIGIHTGELVAGDIGSEQLLEYTVIGDTVSTASRIEGLNKDFHTGILISGQTVAAVGESDLPLKHLGTQGVRGRAETLELYTVDLPDLPGVTPTDQEKSAP